MPVEEEDKDAGFFIESFPPEGDPANSKGPEASSEQIPLQPTEPLRAGMTVPLPEGEEAQDESEQDPEPLPEFDPKHRELFDGLMFVGALTEEFTWFGHKFKIRTLTVDEILEVGLIHRDYVGTMSEVKAYQAAVVAGCLISVDGQSLPLPISNDPDDTPLSNRFLYVREKYFPITLDAVYERYLMLEEKVARVVEELGKVPS